MIIRVPRFNIYLLGAMLLALQTGCQTSDSNPEKRIATIRLHIEVNRDSLGRSEPVPISRAAQVMINVEKTAFLDESHVTEAKVVDSHGGFSIALQFDQRGTWLLEQYTATNPGKHIAIASQFGPKLEETRWLAGPLINHRISDGHLTFTPDASREEAEEIVRGLNHVAIESGNQPKPKKSKKK